MVPLGIITAILRAIRVAGPKWARAFIGRARENRAAPELELMSSTSHEVCEVFNGKGIVRVMGKPKMMEFIFIPSEAKEDVTYGIHTLNSALERKRLTSKRTSLCTHSDAKKRTASGKSNRITSEEEIIGVHKPDRESVRNPNQMWSTAENSTADWYLASGEPNRPAPNLQLNLPHDLRSVRCTFKELWTAAITAVATQLLVVTASAITTFLPHFKLANASPQSRYGFWLFSGGTLCLNVGMFFCSWVIDHSARKTIWSRPNVQHAKNEITSTTQMRKNAQRNLVFRPIFFHNPQLDIIGNAMSELNVTDHGFYLFWLQQEHTVIDQKFEPCLIFGGIKDDILTSHRIDTRQSKNASRSAASQWIFAIAADQLELFSIVGALLGITGFIVQLEGLRNLTWQTPAAQILAIFLMAFIRAAVRRRLAETVPFIPAWRSHELDCEQSTPSKDGACTNYR